MKPINPALLLAEAFSALLRDWMTPAEMTEAVSLNRDEQDLSVCHSHDFIDANLAMIQAFAETQERPLNFQTAEDVALINAAWDLAKASGFQLRPGRFAHV